MYEADDQERAHTERNRQARARGEGIRAELKTRLGEGAQSAAELLAHLAEDVSLSEVAFQLERLAEEGEAVGEEGSRYSLP